MTDQNRTDIKRLDLPEEALNAALEAQVNALNQVHGEILVKILLAAEAQPFNAPKTPLRVFLVGGAVRDLLLEKAVRDLDVLVEGDLTAITDQLPQLEWKFYERFMTASVVLDTGELDLITARSEIYSAPGQLPEVTPDSARIDLERRDFTVNAMALELTLLDDVAPERCGPAGRQILVQLLDPLNGLEDLRQGRLRVLHDQSFYDDPTRLYRAVRYMARLGLTPTKETELQMRQSVKEGVLQTLTNDRILRELFLNFKENRCAEAFRLMADYGLLALGENTFSEAGLTESYQAACVVEGASGLCPEDRAGCLLGYLSLKSPDFAERFRQSSLSRRIKNTARAVIAENPEALASALGVNLSWPRPAEPSVQGTSGPAEEEKGSHYAVRLDAFEGPMDLLLHLIQDNEIDIYDIPIATLCTQYLEYLTQMEQARVEVAGDFLVMAATLLEIKSMMLLPDREAGIFEAWDAAEDPRTELVTKLVEYKRYKEAARLLGGMELTEGAYYTREASDLSEVLPVNPEALNAPAELDLLTEALRRVLSKLDRTDPHREHFFSTMHREPYAVEDAIRLLTTRLKTEETLAFEALFDPGATRNVIVTTFLALLELLKLKRVKVLQAEMFSGIVIQRRDPSETEALLTQDTLLEHWYEEVHPEALGEAEPETASQTASEEAPEAVIQESTEKGAQD